MTSLVAIVTGGESGIGEATFRRFVGPGLRAGILDVDVDRAAAQSENLGADVCVSVPCDVSSRKAITAVVDEVDSRFSQIDVVTRYVGTMSGESRTYR